MWMEFSHMARSNDYYGMLYPVWQIVAEERLWTDEGEVKEKDKERKKHQ